MSEIDETKNLSRPIIGQLSINSLRNKFQFLADQVNNLKMYY